MISSLEELISRLRELIYDPGGLVPGLRGLITCCSVSQGHFSALSIEEMDVSNLALVFYRISTPWGRPPCLKSKRIT